MLVLTSNKQFLLLLCKIWLLLDVSMYLLSLRRIVHKLIRFGNFIVYDALKKENPMQHKNKPGFRGKRIQNTAAITEEALAFKANGWTVALSLLS